MPHTIGPAGLLILALIIGALIWLRSRSRKKKARDQARITQSLEEIARLKSRDRKPH